MSTKANQELLEGETWRQKNKAWNSEYENELKKEIEQYRPLPGLGVPQARVLLVGPIGAGKSSFFNTINSIYRGYVTSQACSGSTDHSLTSHFRMYQVRNVRSRRSLNFRLCDTPGLEEDQGLDAHETCFLLDGNIPDRYMFNPSIPFSSDIPGYVSKPLLKDRIHVVAFVLDASTVDVISGKVIERMKAIQTKMNQRGIPQVVLLTKIDKVCEPLTHNVSRTYQERQIQEYIDKVSQLIGLPRAHILPVKNYEKETGLDDNVNILALLSLQTILRFADDFLYNTLDEQVRDEEMELRMKMAGLVFISVCFAFVAYMLYVKLTFQSM